MGHKVGIWIDHKRAVIVSTSGGGVTTNTLESQVGAHGRFSGQSGFPGAAGPQDSGGSGGEKKYEERNDQQLHRYYEDVIAHLGQPEELLIFGPSEAKLQLKERLTHHKVLSRCVVKVETSDKLTDPQIVAKVKEHYGIER